MLSERGQTYLVSLTRDRTWVTEEEVTEEYFKSNGVKDYSALMHFQLNYSGYTLTKKGKPLSSFTAQLVSREQLNYRGVLDFFEEKNTLLFPCGFHRTAQISFYLTQRGEFCTLGDADDINIISESFDREVERYVMHDELQDWIEHPYYYNFGNGEKFEELTLDFRLIEECSDQYCSWWTSDKVVVIKGTWLDRQEFYLHFYGRNENLVNNFIERMMKENIVKISPKKL
jgi:hypothetical protein